MNPLLYLIPIHDNFSNQTFSRIFIAPLSVIIRAFFRVFSFVVVFSFVGTASWCRYTFLSVLKSCICFTIKILRTAAKTSYLIITYQVPHTGCCPWHFNVRFIHIGWLREAKSHLYCLNTRGKVNRQPTFWLQVLLF